MQAAIINNRYLRPRPGKAVTTVQVLDLPSKARKRKRKEVLAEKAQDNSVNRGEQRNEPKIEVLIGSASNQTEKVERLEEGTNRKRKIVSKDNRELRVPDSSAKQDERAGGVGVESLVLIEASGIESTKAESGGEAHEEEDTEVQNSALQSLSVSKETQRSPVLEGSEEGAGGEAETQVLIESSVTESAEAESEIDGGVNKDEYETKVQNAALQTLSPTKGIQVQIPVSHTNNNILMEAQEVTKTEVPKSQDNLEIEITKSPANEPSTPSPNIQDPATTQNQETSIPELPEASTNKPSTTSTIKNPALTQDQDQDTPIPEAPENQSPPRGRREDKPEVLRLRHLDNTLCRGENDDNEYWEQYLEQDATFSPNILTPIHVTTPETPEEGQMDFEVDLDSPNTKWKKRVRIYEEAVNREPKPPTPSEVCLEKEAWNAMDTVFSIQSSAKEYQTWAVACDLFFEADREKVDLSLFPVVHGWKCKRRDCARAEKLGICHHDVGRVLRGYKGWDAEWVEQVGEWWGGGTEGYEGEIGDLVSEMKILIEKVAEDEKETKKKGKAAEEEAEREEKKSGGLGGDRGHE